MSAPWFTTCSAVLSGHARLCSPRTTTSSGWRPGYPAQGYSAVVSETLVDRSLMFVGFRLDDWDFRVVFNAIKSFGGRGLFNESLHVGVQLSPDSQLIEPEAAQEYFESYFGNDKVNIFWGETRHFFDEFRSQYRARDVTRLRTRPRQSSPRRD